MATAGVDLNMPSAGFFVSGASGSYTHHCAPEAGEAQTTITFNVNSVTVARGGKSFDLEDLKLTVDVYNGLPEGYTWCVRTVICCSSRGCYYVSW